MDIFSMRNKRKSYKSTYNVPSVPAFGYQTAIVQGIGSRDDQEDAFSFVNDHDVLKIQQEGLLAVVADGMGGMADGKEASAAAISSLIKSFYDIDRSKNIPSQIYNAIHLANEKINDLLKGLGGSTVVFCMFYKEKLWFASVGDSGLYLMRNQQLNRLNRRHTLCNQIMLKTLHSGSLDPSEGRNDSQANALSSYLGTENLSEVDYLLKPFCLEPGDVVLLCSDGIDGTLDEDTIISCLNQTTPEYSCYALENKIIKRAKRYQDNYTGLVVRCVK